MIKLVSLNIEKTQGMKEERNCSFQVSMLGANTLVVVPTTVSETVGKKKKEEPN